MFLWDKANIQLRSAGQGQWRFCHQRLASFRAVTLCNKGNIECHYFDCWLWPWKQFGLLTLKCLVPQGSSWARTMLLFLRPHPSEGRVSAGHHCHFHMNRYPVWNFHAAILIHIHPNLWLYFYWNVESFPQRQCLKHWAFHILFPKASLSESPFSLHSMGQCLLITNTSLWLLPFALRHEWTITLLFFCSSQPSALSRSTTGWGLCHPCQEFY